MNDLRGFIQVIVGPRQVGKTTMVSQLLEQSEREYVFESADAVQLNRPHGLTRYGTQQGRE